MDMDQFLIMLVVLLKWLKWVKKSEKELMDLMLLVTLLPPSEKDSLSDLLLSSHSHSLVGSCTMPISKEELKSH